jgi:hypothetical protein
MLERRFHADLLMGGQAASHKNDVQQHNRADKPRK